MTKSIMVAMRTPEQRTTVVRVAAALKVHIVPIGT